MCYNYFLTDYKKLSLKKHEKQINLNYLNTQENSNHFKENYHNLNLKSYRIKLIFTKI